MDRLISEQKAIEAINDYWGEMETPTIVGYINAIKAITSAESKTGHWFVDERPECNREVICSNCEQPIFKYHKIDFDYRPKFCPNCGARMESEKNE